MFEEVRLDCAALLDGKSLDRRPLWDGDTPLASLLAETRPQILAQGDGWRFWVDWYDNALQGRAQDYDLLTKIALIEPTDWDKGADHVNALIAEIIAQHNKSGSGPSGRVDKATIQIVQSAIAPNGKPPARATVMRP